MPLQEDLLTPIAGDNPSGVSLRYDRVYDQIKEARTEEDDTLPSGAWARQAKRADFRLVIKLASDALATRSKDLQLAVWLGEALLKQDGISSLAPTLRLALALQQAFWETLYPEVDEGDAGMRAAPLQWTATRYAKLVNETALTRKGIGFLEYKAARAMGTEEEAASNPQKQQLREEAVATGKPTPEELDDAIAATPKAFYVALEQSFTQGLAALSDLDTFCEERYGADDTPSFRALRQALEEVQHLASSLLREKRKLEPDVLEVAPAETSEEVEVEQAAEAAPAMTEVEPVVVSTPAKRARSGAVAGTPETWEDALARVEGAVAYLGGQQPESPLPFLLRSSMRAAELLQLKAADRLDRLAAPSTELRQSLRRAASEGDWSEVHRAAMAALGTPCGCGWLDLYRFLWTSCWQKDWYAQLAVVAGTVQQRLREVPSLPTLTLDDDTPSANAETLRWIAEEIAPPSMQEAPEPAPCEACARAAEREAAPTLTSVLAVEREREDLRDEEDLFVTARGMAIHGQIQGAIQLLARDAAQQSVGRLRYERNLQIAELCLESGNSAVAVPVLQRLVREVEERRLETWEAPDSAAKPYALLLQCAAVAKLDTQTIFARLCAIDPGVALTMAPPVES